MPLLRNIFFVLLLFGKGFTAFSQQYYFKNYSAENGLPFVQVYTIFEDSKGFLYTGGYSGISRFDGKEFTNITTKHGLNDNNVNAFCEDEENRIWIGTNAGLNILKDQKVLKTEWNIDLSAYNILSLKHQKGGAIYIGTSNGLFTYKDLKLKRIEPTNGIEIHDIIVNKTSVYCATNKGLMKLEGESVAFITTKNGLSSNNINCLALSPMADVMSIGTTNGLNFLNLKNGKIVSYYVENGLIDNNISCLLYDASNELWIGSQTGLIKFENNEFNYYNIYYDNNSNLIRCILKDTEGNVWFGTHSGIYRYRDNSFSTFDKINGPGNAFIFEIFKVNNELFVCSENNGIYKYTNGYFKRYGIANGLPSNICRTGTVNKNGRVFFDTEGGIVEMKGETFVKIPVSKQLASSHFKMYCDRKDRIWCGGTNGVATFSFNANNKIDTAFLKFPTTKEEFSVNDMCEDEQGNLFIAVYQLGLFCYNGKEIFDYGKSLGIDRGDIVSVKCTKKYLYVATLNGLLIVDVKTKTHQFITQKDGLISDIIYSLGFAKNNTCLWIGTNIGVCELNITEFENNGKLNFRSYGKNEGFAGIECNSNGIFEDTDGTVWFGTVSGLIKHLPNNYLHNKNQNKLNIYKFKLADNDTILTDGIKIPFSNNNITFYYRGICLTNPEKVLYSKKLEGYDMEFSLPTEENFTKYTNLGPGTYTLKVISCNNEGLWNEQPTTFVFTILTPFYRTWWFALLTISITGFAVYFVFKIRLNNIKNKQQKDFERKVEVSKIELKALRAQMNPHFVFNSLNSIQHYIFNSKSDEAVKYLNKFAKLMRVILNNSDKPTVAIEDDLEALKLYLELEQMRFEDKFEYKIEIEDNVDLDYDIMPPMLLQPYVENAILHGLTPRAEKGMLHIGIRSEENFIVCTITDNGIGRKRSAEIKRTMPGNKHKSLGMKITEERLRILNEISKSEHSVQITDLENADGSSSGTRVELYVPIL